MRNEDLSQLAQIITPGVTPVLIAEEVSYRRASDWHMTVQQLVEQFPVTGLLAVVATPDYAVLMPRDGNGGSLKTDRSARFPARHGGATEVFGLMRSRSQWRSELSDARHPRTTQRCAATIVAATAARAFRARKRFRPAPRQMANNMMASTGMNNGTEELKAATGLPP
jgi:hypothetical protein